MQHRVPAGDPHIEMIHLAQDLRREDESENDHLEHRRDIHLHLVLQDRRNKKQKQCQQAQSGALVIPADNTPYHL